MNSQDILKRLAACAAECDKSGLFNEADTITAVMLRLNPPAPKSK